jgi:hypothetical protein
VNVTLEADPPATYAGGKTILYVDVENLGGQTLRNMNIELFAPGLFSASACRKTISVLNPNRFTTLSCGLQAPLEISTFPTNNLVNVRVSYTTTFSTVYNLELMSPELYRQKQVTGTLNRHSGSRVFKDNIIELDVDLSTDLPIVDNPDKKEYMYLTIKNIGPGIMSSIQPSDFWIQQNGNIVNCNLNSVISPSGDTFPRIACEINPPGDIKYLSNYDVIVNINYHYEIRQSLPIEITR